MDYIQSHIKNDIELWLGIKDARNSLYTVIFKVFTPKLNIKNVRKLYKPLFENIFDKLKQSFIPIFTTNYDLVLETFAEDESYFVETGFDRKGGRLIWSPHLFHQFEPKHNQLSLALFKLHGSISWRKEQDKIVNYGLSPINAPGDPALIYPTQTKEYPYEEPFKTAYSFFGDCLFNAKFLISIGYSFRDKSINNVIHDAAKTNKRLRLIRACILDTDLVS